MTTINYPLAVGSGTTRIIESGSGPPVLFVHGLGARADRWRTTVERVGDRGYRAIAFDLPGHGFASKEDDAPSTVPAISAYLLELLDRLSIERAILVGTSLGAHIVAYAATLAPARVSALVLVGALGIVPIDQAVAETIARNVQVTERAMFAGKLNFVVHDPAMVTTQMVEEEWRMNTAPGAIRAFSRLARYLVEDIAQDDVAERLRELYPPDRLLLIWGAEDKAVPLAVGKACEAALGVQLAIVPKANHVPYWEQPEGFDAVLLPFLRSASGPLAAAAAP